MVVSLRFLMFIARMCIIEFDCSTCIFIDTMSDEKDLWAAKGSLNILRFLLTLENTTKITMEQSNED